MKKTKRIQKLLAILMCMVLCLGDLSGIFSIEVKAEDKSVIETEGFNYFSPDDDNIPYFYLKVDNDFINEYQPEDGALLNLGYPVYAVLTKDTSETLAWKYRVYGELIEEGVPGTRGFYSVDNTGVVNNEDTELRTLDSDSGIRGKFQGGTWVDDSAKITKVVYQEEPRTGIAPFDEGEEIPVEPTIDQLKTYEIAGTDKNNQNSVIRVGDDIVYQVMVTSDLNEGKSGTDQASIYASLKGGALYFKASIPEYTGIKLAWDTDNMSWIKNLQVTEEGRTITGYMQMPTDKNSVPGAQTMQFALKVKEGANAQTFNIEPDFDFYWKGNETDPDKFTITNNEADKYEEVSYSKPQTIVTSAKSSYNLNLISNGSNACTRNASEYADAELTLLKNDSGTKVYGKNYGFISSVMIQSDDAEKLFKGYELPKGSITYDLNIEILDSNNNNVTEKLLPTVVQANYNGYYGLTSSNMTNSDFIGNYTSCVSKPYSAYGGSLDKFAKLESNFRYVYNSGKYSIMNGEGHLSLDNAKISVTSGGIGKISIDITDYVNESFPTHGSNANTNTALGTDGYISLFAFTIFIPGEAGKIYKVRVYNDNMNIVSAGGTVNDNSMQSTTTDDQVSFTHSVAKINANISKANYVYRDSESGNEVRQPNVNYTFYGEDMWFSSQVINNTSIATEECDIKTAVSLSKFDAALYKPTGKYISDSSINYSKVYWAVKKDGTNWTNYDEMEQTEIMT